MLALALALILLSGCAGAPEAPGHSAQSTAGASAPKSQVASSSEMAAPVELDTEGLTPTYAGSLKNGTYPIAADSSSSMFRIAGCELTVEDGHMTAVMTMGGTGYLYLCPGTAQWAASAGEENYIPFEENEAGEHTFTLPVEALDMPINCAAFSKSKEKWYDRTLIFRSASLPLEVFADGFLTTAESLGLADGTYAVEVSLEGGSGKASVRSPANLFVHGGVCTAEIVWGSSNYDYMKVAGEQYDPVNTGANSTFIIPVAAFDRSLTVLADTTAMSQPHEIEYTLYFNSSTIQEVQP